MQQRQPRLGDILDDYCPRERRVTNHAVVAMLGDDVKQTRCTTCDAEHEYKHAKVPRQRRKNETPAALYSQVLAGAPKRVAHGEHGEAVTGTNGSNGANGAESSEDLGQPVVAEEAVDKAVGETVAGTIVEPSGGVAEALDESPPLAAALDAQVERSEDAEPEDTRGNEEEEGPVHRPLIRASLPRHEGQPPPTRPIPEFTIRQPAGRQNRFRPRHQRGVPGGQQFGGNRGNGNFPGGPPRGMRPGGGRPPQGLARRNGPGRKRSK
jgi:hypothetical protein